MSCVTVFTRCVYVANATATGSLLSALIQLLITIYYIYIYILKLKYLQTTNTTKNDVFVN